MFERSQEASNPPLCQYTIIQASTSSLAFYGKPQKPIRSRLAVFEVVDPRLARVLFRIKHIHKANENGRKLQSPCHEERTYDPFTVISGEEFGGTNEQSSPFNCLLSEGLTNGSVHFLGEIGCFSV